MRVDLLVLTWNEREMLDIVLPSIERQTYRDFLTTVIDNGSEDGTVEYLRSEWPQVNVLDLGDNVGFPAGNNAGIRATSGEYVALLNNDVELDPHWLERMVETLDAHPEAAGAAGKMLNYDDRRVLDGAGDFMSRDGVWGRRGHGELDRGQYDEPGEVMSVCAAAALYRREAFEAVGLLDEDLTPIYLEDADWGMRAALAGYTFRYEPAAVAYHVGGATTKKRGDFEVYQLQRNSFALVAKNVPRERLLADGSRFLVRQLKMLAASPREGTTRVRLRAWWAAARMLPRFVRKRRDVHSRRRPVRAEARPAPATADAEAAPR